MTKTRITHGGRKTAVYVNQENFVAYLSKANTRNESTYLTLSVFDEFDNQTKIRLDGKQVSTLKKILA